MSSINDLTNLANCKLWQGSQNTGGDAQLQRLVTSISMQVLTFLQRETFLSRSIKDVYDGTGQMQMVLRRWPVTSISQVLVDNVIIPLIPADTGTQSPVNSTFGTPWGYRCELWDGRPPGGPAYLEGRSGFRFAKGTQNIAVTYTAGYLQANEAAVIPASPFKVTTIQPQGIWIGDNGVTYASTGTALVLVASNPTIGQYSMVPDTPGVYQFAAADVGAAVLISYSFCPYDVEQTVLELIAETLARRNRPGVASQNLIGSETAVYDRSSGLSGWAGQALQNYKQVIPV